MTIERILGTDTRKAAFEKSDRNFVLQEGILDEHKILNSADAHSAAPILIAYNSASQLIENNILTVLQFNSEIKDTHNMHADIDNTKFVCKKTGMYLVIVSVNWDNNSTGIRQVKILKNNLTSKLKIEASIGWHQNQLIDIVDLVENDYITIQAYQASGAPLNVLGSSSETKLTIVRIA